MRTTALALLACAAAACRNVAPAPTAARSEGAAVDGGAAEANARGGAAGESGSAAARPVADAGATPDARVASPPDAGARETRVTLVFAASTAGQLVPCGCSPDQRGGLPRAVSLAQKLRRDNPNFLFADAGDLLFESAARPPKQMLTQKELKARALARGEELLGAVARVVGQRDLALGADLLTATSGAVPLLDAGAPVPGTRATLLAHAGSVPVGLFAAGLGEKPEATIAARARELRAQGARLVVLLLQPRGDNAFAAAQALVPAAHEAGVDLIVVGRRDDPASDPDRKDASSPPVLAVEGHGQSFLRVDVVLGRGPLVLARAAEEKSGDLRALDERIERFRRQAEAAPERRAQLLAKVAELQARRASAAAAVEKAPEGATVATATFVPLTAEAGEDAEAKKLVDAYDARVSQLNLEEAKTQPESCPAARRGEASFVGVQRCAECHATEAAFWSKTNHAHAFQTLVKVNKQFSLDCIRCHVSGWQQPGGVCRIDRAAVGGAGLAGGFGVGRQDVQCEVCHGAGSEHVKDPPEHIAGKVPVAVCMRCHEAANSPHFDDAKYRPFIVGPGHGAPLAAGETPHPFATGKGPLLP